MKNELRNHGPLKKEKKKKNTCQSHFSNNSMIESILPVLKYFSGSNFLNSKEKE
jgi:hypothetical protein